MGSDWRDGARSALKCIVRANARSDKTPALLELREELEEWNVLLRLSNDLKAFGNFNAFEHAITQAYLDIAIAKQFYAKI